MDYRPPRARASEDVLAEPTKAFVARYALGRDYHKVLRAKLQRLADRIAAAIGPFGYRVFTDSAPVLEVALAARSGIGWRGKHTLLLDARSRLVVLPGRALHRPAAARDAAAGAALRHVHRLHRRLPDAGDRRALRARRAPLHLVPDDRASRQHPRVAAAADRQSDLRLRRLPARLPVEPLREGRGGAGFAVRHGLDDADLVTLFGWKQRDFLERTAGSAIRRIGYERWLRNLAVALGNAPHDPAIVAALETRAGDPSPLVREHVAWALARQRRVEANASAPT